MREILAVLLLVLPVIASAQKFPERPIHIVVPLPPGGSPDTLARTLAQALPAAWSQPVVVENRTGGSQNIGAEFVAKSAPDGYTWLLATDNVFSMNPYLTKLSFDPLTDFAPVTPVARVPFLLVVHPSLPVKTLQELIVYAKAHPGEINYGSAGSGNTQHLAALQLERLSGIRMNHVPYRGAAPAITDLLPGRIQLFIGAANQLLPHIREGRLRLLATTAPRRLAHLGDIPAIGEAVPGYAVESWLGVFMPAKTPTDIVLRASVEIDRILSAPELKAKLALQGIDVMTSTPSEFARFVRDDNKRWGSLIKDSNIRLE